MNTEHLWAVAAIRQSCLQQLSCAVWVFGPTPHQSAREAVLTAPGQQGLCGRFRFVSTMYLL